MDTKAFAATVHQLSVHFLLLLLLLLGTREEEEKKKLLDVYRR
jgi:hypothetical protein